MFAIGSVQTRAAPEPAPEPAPQPAPQPAPEPGRGNGPPIKIEKCGKNGRFC